MELDNVNRILEDYREDFINILTERLKMAGRVASGQLINNLETNIKTKGTEIAITLIHADYLLQTTEGRGPTQNGGDGTVQEKIEQWIRDKGILPTEKTDRDGKRYLPTEKQLAYLIARKIHREGFSGDDVLYDVIEEVNATYIPLLQEALEKDFGVYQIKVLEKINKMIKI